VDHKERTAPDKRHPRAGAMPYPRLPKGPIDHIGEMPNDMVGNEIAYPP
jgi:hypothetical protein